MESIHLEIFRSVARAGNMTRAARDLNTVQSNVTARIRSLEDELGVSLFHRHKRGVTLTTAGEQLVPYAEKVSQLLADARQAVSATATPRGPLRIGSLETTAALRLAPILTRFSRLYPAVDLSLVTGTSAALIVDVLEYRLEGAFVVGPIEDGRLTARTVVEEELVLYTPASMHDPRNRLENTDPKLLVFRVGCSYRERLENLYRRLGAARVRIAEFGSLEGIFACVAAGMGVTLLPRALADDTLWRARFGAAIAIHRLSRREAIVPTVFIQRRNGFASAAVRCLLELVASERSGAARSRRPGSGASAPVRAGRARAGQRRSG